MVHVLGFPPFAVSHRPAVHSAFLLSFLCFFSLPHCAIPHWRLDWPCFTNPVYKGLTHHMGGAKKNGGIPFILPMLQVTAVVECWKKKLKNKNNKLSKLCSLRTTLVVLRECVRAPRCVSFDSWARIFQLIKQA